MRRKGKAAEEAAPWAPGSGEGAICWGLMGTPHPSPELSGAQPLGTRLGDPHCQRRKTAEVGCTESVDHQLPKHSLSFFHEGTLLGNS